MINKDNLIGEKPASTIQRFAQPALRYLFLLVVVTMIGCALIISLDPNGDRETVAFVGGGMSAILLLTVLLFGRQRVEINGTTVRISNIGTLHRWRTFNVEEVVELRFADDTNQGLLIGLNVTLRESPGRKWKSFHIIKTVLTIISDKKIDSPVFLAFVAAIKIAHPDIKVKNLPASYRGALPRA